MGDLFDLIESEEENETEQESDKKEEIQKEEKVEWQPYEIQLANTKSENIIAMCQLLKTQWDKDKNLQAKFNERKVLLTNLWDWISKKALERVKNKSGTQGVYYTDSEMLGDLVHAIYDEDLSKVEQPKDVVVSTKPIATTKKKEKVKKEETDNGQMSLFDF